MSMKFIIEFRNTILKFIRSHKRPGISKMTLSKNEERKIKKEGRNKGSKKERIEKRKERRRKKESWQHHNVQFQQVLQSYSN